MSEEHPIGRSKAKLFRLHGFNATHADLLAQLLIHLVQSEEVTEVVLSPHGTKYIVEGQISTILEEIVMLRTVWIIETGENRLRFITAYPAK